MAGQLKVNGVTLATEESGTVTLEAPQIKDSSNNVILDQSGTNPVLKNVEVVNNSSMMFRNRIINGDMRIDQRNGGSSTSLNSTDYTLDRWIIQASGLDEASLNISQYSMTASDLNSTGFSNALKVEVGTAESSIAADEYVSIQQRIEAQNLTDLKFGTASAKSLMLSFWVKTSLTGTYGITLEKMDTTARLINKSFTTLTTDWEKVTIPITGDTDSSALISDDNGEGFRLSFWLGVGSDYTTSSSNSWINYSDPYWAGTHQQNAFLTTQNATFYITGVQLEVGTVATPFEHRPYGAELALCQRYFQISPAYAYFPAANGNASTVETNFILPTPMRATPTFSTSTGSYDTSIYHPSVRTIGTATPFSINYDTNSNIVRFIQGGFSGMTAIDQSCAFQSRKDILISAEL